MFVFVLCNYWRKLAYFNKIWFLTCLYVKLSIFHSFFVCRLGELYGLKLAYEKPLLAFGMGFSFSQLGLLSGLYIINAP